MKKLIIFALFAVQIIFAKAFPEAQGYGASSVGGRNGKVIYVTNLNDTGTGSFRSALYYPAPRTILFAVSGVIHAKTQMVVTNPYLTIAGQTSPSNGITIIGSGIYIATHDVIIRHLRIRNGDTTLAHTCDDRDAITMGENSYNVIVDHVSLSWAVDENFSTWYNAHDITLQNSIISEGLAYSCHPKGEHSKGILIGDSTMRISMYHNYLESNYDRNPTIKGCSKSDFVNNVVYNFGGFAFAFGYDYCVNSHDTTMVNNLYNYYKRGPSTLNWAKFFFAGDTSYPTKTMIYVNGNEGNDSLLLYYNSHQSAFIAAHPSYLVSSLVNYANNISYTNPISSALYDFLNDVGATKPKRDYIDTRVINEFISGKGAIINSQNDVGGYPKFTATTTNDSLLYIYDKDKDGLPNSYEILKGLNPGNPNDAKITNSDGYTNLEIYLNSL